MTFSIKRPPARPAGKSVFLTLAAAFFLLLSYSGAHAMDLSDGPILVAAKEDSVRKRGLPAGGGKPAETGAIKELEEQIEHLEKAVSVEIADIRMSINELKRGAGLTPGPSYSAGKPVGLRTGSASAVKSMYAQARQTYLRKNFTAAAGMFSNILAQSPTDALAPNARYWLGECQYDQGRYNEAVSEFQRVVRDYPRSHKASDALLKIAFSYDKLKDGSAAMTSLSVLLKRYPNSRAAKMVKTGRTRFSQ